MIFHLSTNAGRQDHAVLQASLQLHSLFVALVVDASEYEDVEDEQGTTDSDRYAQRRRISAVLFCVAVAAVTTSHRASIATRRRQNARTVGQLTGRFWFTVLLAVRLSGRIHHK